MRKALVTIHRWFGLFAAVFLFVAGLTGAIISWDHELDEWLNPQLFVSRSGAVAMYEPLELARRLEAADPRLRVSVLPLLIEAGHTLNVSVDARVDPSTGRLFDLGFNQVALDPATGEIQGRREWGAISLSRENLLPFLYKLHYSLHIPDVGDWRTGVWFMGLLAVVWVIDCFIALWIAFPRLGYWRKSFMFRWNLGFHESQLGRHAA